MKPALIIGVGNPLRGDDGAGREAARRLRQRDVPHARIVEVDGEATALLSLMENAECVYLIDACVSGAPAGSVRRIDVAQTHLPEAAFGLSSHGFGLSEAVALAKTFHTLPAQCVIYAIEGESFDRGASLSEPVSRAVDAVVLDLCREIGAQD